MSEPVSVSKLAPPCAFCGRVMVDYCSECHTPVCVEHVVRLLVIAHCKEHAPNFTKLVAKESKRG